MESIKFTLLLFVCVVFALIAVRYAIILASAIFFGFTALFLGVVIAMFLWMFFKMK